MQNKLPSEIKQFLQDKLEIVWSNHNHHLKPSERIEIYKLFQEKDEKLAQKFIGWLEVITAEYVLPIWKQALPKDTSAEQLLAIAKEVLTNELEFEAVARNENADYLYHFLGSIVVEKFPANVRFAGEAVLNAFYHTKMPLFAYIKITPDMTDEKFYDVLGGDAASSAVKAYAGLSIDNLWTEKADPEKKLEFWEWWLTEAIPQAWELAQAD